MFHARRLLALACLGLSAGPAGAVTDPPRPPVVVGVNVVNPQWQSRAVQDKALDGVRDAGIRTIRIPLLPPAGGDYGGTIEYMARAKGRGLDVVLIVYPAFPDDAPTRPKIPSEPEVWPLPPLSLADPAVLRDTYGPVLKRLDAAGIRLAAIEFGNELNWAAFNGEFPYPGKGIVLGPTDLATTDLGRRIADGYRAYLRSLAALKAIRDGLGVNRTTPLLAAGFADVGPVGNDIKRPLDAVNVGATLSFMRIHGLDRLVDGYSIHVYPDPAGTPETRRRDVLRDFVAECGPVAGIGKPCWLTEWSFPDSGACRGDDAPRQALVSEFGATIAPALADGRIRGLVYYSWSGDDPYSLTRCGRLLPGGAAAMALGTGRDPAEAGAAVQKRNTP